MIAHSLSRMTTKSRNEKVGGGAKTEELPEVLGFREKVVGLVEAVVVLEAVLGRFAEIVLGKFAD
uniref:Uncharacterized protein n=1 Tax=Meloidogyne incognita TaxID=6306 RepID=A0A914MSK4_MELIC